MEKTTTRLHNMMADYFKETSGYETVEVPNVGFYSYRKFGEECHIGHFYILPELRKKGLAPELGEAMINKAREIGCTYMSCIVDFENRENDVASRLVKTYLNFGFNVHSMVGNTQIILKRDI